jgi:uncharacterized protein (DUF1330 family)
MLRTVFWNHCQPIAGPADFASPKSLNTYERRKIMSAYVVYVRDRITDPEEFSKYEQAAPAASEGHTLKPLAFYGAVETLEGPPVDGAVILEFETVEQAHALYDSAPYQEAMKHRLKGAEYRVFIIEGVTG